MPDTNWKEEWRGMPEFVQEQERPHRTLTVRFPDEASLQEFAEVICQQITPKTKSLWYPPLVRGQHSSKRYKDESRLPAVCDLKG